MENGWYWVRWHEEDILEVLRFFAVPGEKGGWHASGMSMPMDPTAFAVVARIETPDHSV
jgi:hypothetical protein